MRSTIVLCLALCLATLAMPANAHEKQTANTLKLSAGEKSPPATLAEMKWLEGHWTGEAFGGVGEEIWSPAQAGSMMGMYRLIQKGKPVFYELCTVVEENGGLILRLKHFNADLTGWEEKNDTVDFPLVAVEKGAMHFDGMSFHPQGETLTVYLAIRQKDGKLTEQKFVYSRVRDSAK
jgi:hypothetical protein